VDIIITLWFLRLGEMQNAESKSERIILTLVPLIILDMGEWMRKKQNEIARIIMTFRFDCFKCVSICSECIFG
jgi:hypothetical protein